MFKSLKRIMSELTFSKFFQLLVTLLFFGMGWFILLVWGVKRSITSEQIESAISVLSTMATPTGLVLTALVGKNAVDNYQKIKVGSSEHSNDTAQNNEGGI